MGQPADVARLMLLAPRDNDAYCQANGLFIALPVQGGIARVNKFEMILSERNVVTIMVMLGQSQKTIGIGPGQELTLNPKHLLQEMAGLGEDWFETTFEPFNDDSASDGITMKPRPGTAWGQKVNTGNGTARSQLAFQRYLTMLRMLCIECERRETDLIMRHVSPQELYYYG